MRIIKVSYRAVFEQPIGILNPLGAKLPGQCPVEVFQKSNKWQVRELQTAQRRVYEKLGKFHTAGMAQDAAYQAYARQVQDWQMWGMPPLTPMETRDLKPMERPLRVDEVSTGADGTVRIKEPEDYTHILHAPTIDPKVKIPPAACGAKVAAGCFISTRANVRPTCTPCAQVWEKEYAKK